MEAVRIMCRLSESQIGKLVDYVASKLPTNIHDLSDIGQPMMMMMNQIRLCVDFDVDALGNLKVLTAEVLDKDWDLLPTDSFALAHYLVPVIDDYNSRKRESKKQAKQIRSQQLTTNSKHPMN